MKGNFQDGQYTFGQLESAVNSDFGSEKELMDFIEHHIKDFCTDLLEVQYETHKREFQLIKTRRNRIKGNRRIDFLIKTIDGQNIIIECKHPKVLCELSNAVGQCLSYKSLLSNIGISATRTILISTKIDNVITQVISDYKLPIEFFVIDRNKCLKFLHYGTANVVQS